jgi:hypothetical protein
MKIEQLGIESNGTRSYEIRAGTISYNALLRCIQKILGATITNSSYYPMTDDAQIDIIYKDIVIAIDVPFSDYIINCNSSSNAFEEFISKLSSYPVKWWDRYF